jgi:hypothetical protein
MKKLSERKGMRVDDFNIGDKVLIANPHMLVNSTSNENDTFSVVETELSFGKWKAAVNDRTGYGLVMANGDWCLT